ncbi:hypothetical protein BDD12DRAFT_988700 [Trichophaea hybrida]|nr:hypothetical protein BDD12DRAFT_988700 [Trichophaea hybrida]
MSGNRSHFRNVRFFDEANPDVVLGGLIQNGSLTEKNFLVMLDIVLVSTAPIRVSAKDTERVVSVVDTRLDVGDYLVSCEGEMQVSDEPWVHRIISHNVSGRENAFRDGIRARDGRCIISGVVNLSAPMQKESLWVQFNYGHWMTDMDDINGVSKINPLQNGFLLNEHIHSLFDQYLLSLNPDDNYKVTVFDVDIWGIDGRILDPVCRDPANPQRVSDQFLRWHFRQSPGRFRTLSVLANMRGAGELVFEHDFPPGTDMITELREGPLTQERFELELSHRLKEVI